ncbi:hypothetical protein D3C72_2500040 [compost metagenome]
MLGKVQGITQRLRRAAVGAHRHQIEGGKLDIGKLRHGLLSLLGSRMADIWRRPLLLCMGTSAGINARDSNPAELA